jgi:hypothetical protein
MDKVGREGVVTVEEAKSLKSELEIVAGTRFDRGYLSPYFITDAEKMVCELEQPYVLLHDKKLSALPALLPILDAAARAGPEGLHDLPPQPHHRRSSQGRRREPGGAALLRDRARGRLKTCMDACSRP